MEKTTQHKHLIPAGISEYIKSNFREDFLTDIKESKDQNGEPCYFVDVSHDENLYHLKFNSRGELIQKEMEPLPELPDDDLGVGD